MYINKKCYRYIDNHSFDEEMISTCNFYRDGIEKCEEYMKLEV
jgi:hypothetical protein